MYREDEISARLNSAGYSPLDILITGVTGAGKSTTLNRFFQKTVAREGEGVDPETMSINKYQLTDDIRLWDTPGLGDGVLRDEEHSRNIVAKLNQVCKIGNEEGYLLIDLTLVVLDGGAREMGMTYRLLNNVICPNIAHDRILVAINQADFAMKGRYWDRNNKRPKAELLDFLYEKVHSIRERIHEATGLYIPLPVFYSAKYNYNIHKLYDLIIDNIPSRRRTWSENGI